MQGMKSTLCMCAEVGGGVEETCGRCSVLSVLLKFPSSLGPLVPLHRKSLIVFSENGFNKTSV